MNKLQRNKGYTVVELIISLWMVVILVGVGFGFYAVAHFIAKAW